MNVYCEAVTFLRPSPVDAQVSSVDHKFVNCNLHQVTVTLCDGKSFEVLRHFGLFIKILNAFVTRVLKHCTRYRTTINLYSLGFEEHNFST